MDESIPLALTVNGLYSMGNRYLQADLNTFSVKRVYGVTVLTSIFSDGEMSSKDGIVLSATSVDRQFGSILNGLHISSCKVGYLPNLDLITAVEQACRNQSVGPVVLDPILFDETGSPILDDTAFSKYVTDLIPLANVITPTIEEAEKIVDFEITSDDDVIHAANELRGIGVQNVLIKGSNEHQGRDNIRDYVLLEDGDDFWLTDKHAPFPQPSGKDDALSACITAELANGQKTENAIRTAKEFITDATRNVLQVGDSIESINFWR
ncbi:Phosphomethylpyrimidine kinase [Furfurilactobacillus rossiae]|uniref:PfkB family carbohydrate kinase n=1 Tax=Furfurilactobacillus rossiae TaxID=231049 RepID=UPI0015BA88A0|nr:PfkB family carbohydrate kinase [Furfurilactobacillus rossiae]MCF6165402.1 hydroxymethylpyrimidine/phosphomethylpyrimidine kinase [Furfurilactobacillus rossiae]QLE64308.1 Phosphomethylpyrimidine kinase [Furfurilactobacillus rossiae]